MAAHWLGMTQHHRPARMALTAIAAVLALSSTPLLAQEAQPPVADPAPEAAPPAADPLAPAAEPAVPATKVATTSAKPAASATRRASATKTSSTRGATRSSAPAAPSAPSPTAVAETPLAPPAGQPVDPGPMPVADPVQVEADQPRSGFAELDPDAAAPIAGGAALGLVLLGGAAAMRRRKRRKQEDADEAAKWAFIESHAEDEQSGPALSGAAAPRHDPVPARMAGGAVAPTTRLPDGFDLSRFGPHVQAAYRGPTADNPSLSLRNRLRRASFFDQQERQAAEAAPSPAEPAARPAETPAAIPAKGNWESRQDADYLFYRAGTKSAAKPALQD